MSQKTAVVVGGGIAGLASAALLAKAGMKVTLLEAREKVGGRAYIWEKDGFVFDMGPSWYLMPDAFDQFFKLMGTTAEKELKLVKLEPAYQTRNEGRDEKLMIVQDLEKNKALFDSIEPGAGKKLQQYLDSAEETYDLSMKHFLYTNFENTKSFTNKEVLGKAPKFLSHLVTSLYAFSGKYVKDERLKKILNFPAVFLGASPYDTPSMYHLMTHVDLNVGVFYPMGGFYTLIEAIERIAKQHGVQIKTNSPVSKIQVNDQGIATGVQVGEVFIEADVVVGTADMHHVETKLLDQKHQTFPEKFWSNKVPGPSAMLLYLGVKGKVPQLNHHTLLYTDNWSKNFSEVFHKADGKRKVPNPASLYICAPSVTDSSVAPEGYENLFVLVPIAADPSIGGSGDEQFEKDVDRVIDQIAQWCEIPDLKERIVVRKSMGPRDFVTELNAWNGTALGMAHTLRQSAFFRPKNRSKKVKNLFYAGHNTIPGIGLPMCLIGAELVYKYLVDDKSTGPISDELQPVPAGGWKGLK
ncbi:MAG: phytoene desaturase family protein [Rhodoluna sp.]